MRSPALLVGAALAFCSSAWARSATGDRVLVVLEPSVKQDDYSKLWSSLKERGFELTFKGPRDGSAELLRFGERQYDHLILYTPSTQSYTSSLSPKSLVEAQFAGINTLYLLSPDLSETNRDLFREYDLEFVEKDQVYLDAFSNAYQASPAITFLSTEKHLVRQGDMFTPSTALGGKRTIVYPSGTVHSTGQNPYLIDVLHGSKTGYVGSDKVLDADEAEVEAALTKSSKGPVLAGKKAALVSAMQTRDNVRLGFVGSGEMFSDKYWNAEIPRSSNVNLITGNGEFANDFIKWVFQETGVVKVVSTHHHREGETEPREMYRKKDDLTYTITLAQHTTTANGSSSWEPFHVSDMQLDFTMLDPHYRTALVEDSGKSSPHSTAYSASFKAPDRHGVFKFVVEYWRPGWSYIRTSDTASVVPLRHDEHPRFITGAWPFYSATISASAAFLLFSALWLAVGEEDRKGKKKAE